MSMMNVYTFLTKKVYNFTKPRCFFSVDEQKSSNNSILSDYSDHVCSVIVQESLVLCLSLIVKVSPIFTCSGNRIPFFFLVFSLPVWSLPLSSFLIVSFFPPLAFDFPLKYGLVLSSCLPPSVGYCLSVLLYGCWELISGPSAVIQLSHSLLSPIHFAPLCPSPRHRSATLLLTTTLLPLTTLSGLLLSVWYSTRERAMPVWAVFFKWFFFPIVFIFSSSYCSNLIF